MTEKDVREFADVLGVPMDTYSPGDGVTRYRFGSDDYFGDSGEDTVLGASAAMDYLRGYAHGTKVRR